MSSDPTHREPGVVHLQERFLHAGLPALVALDAGGLEGQRTQLRHLEGDLAGLGVELALVVAGPGIDAFRVVLVALGATEPVGLGVEQGVERLFHG